jgi:methyl-accepting chemotaxis protein
MAHSVQDVERGVAMVTRTGAIFSEIMQDVAEIGRQVEVTAGAAAELSAGSEQMAAAIQEQSSTMEEVAASAEELRASAEKLFQELAQFKYEKASAQGEADDLS